MLYLSFTFWLLFIVLAALGVQKLWSGLVKPRVINIVLLPGTLVAQLGHVLGLLITGATVTNTALYQDGDGEPGTTQNPKPRIPVIGPVIIGMLPLVACAVCIFLVVHPLGVGVLAGFGESRVASNLPTSLPAVWELLRDFVSMVESLVNAVSAALPGNWRLWLFVYLMICLTVRMAPFPGNIRGSLGAIMLVGVLAALAGLMSSSVHHLVEAGWGILSLTVPTLALLLFVSAAVRGSVELGRLILRNG